jgi:hypothetical protein
MSVSLSVCGIFPMVVGNLHDQGSLFWNNGTECPTVGTHCCITMGRGCCTRTSDHISTRMTYGTTMASHHISVTMTYVSGSQPFGHRDPMFIVG